MGVKLRKVEYDNIKGSAKLQSPYLLQAVAKILTEFVYKFRRPVS